MNSVLHVLSSDAWTVVKFPRDAISHRRLLKWIDKHPSEYRCAWVVQNHINKVSFENEQDAIMFRLNI